jgi:UDP-N-acetylglucosamine:LPS N-acetylglucosamine transferase
MNVGGPAIQAVLLMRGLDPLRYDSRLVTGLPEPSEGDYLELYGLELSGVTEVPELGREVRPLRDWKAYRRLVQLIREFQPDIVHTHTAKAGLIGRLAAWRCGVPVVVHTFHGHVFHGYFSRSKEWLFVMVERMLARVTTTLVAVNATVRDEVLARGVGRQEQFEIVPLGFNCDASSALIARHRSSASWRVSRR